MGRYQDALDYIFSYVNYEKQVRYPYDAVTFNLSRMEEVLDRLGRPQDRFRCVHIAGTKGKGSTSAMVESVLRTAGYRTGLYTSPHLHTFRERIRLDGALMTKAELVELLDRCRPAIEAMPGDHGLRGDDRAGVPVFRRARRRLGRAGGGAGRPAGCHQRRAPCGLRHHLAELRPRRAAGPHAVADRRSRRPASSSRACRWSARRRSRKRWR